MKIVVFGSTGGVGQQVVRHAVAAGHEVTAFLRTPAKLDAPGNVTVVQGDAFDAEALEAFEGMPAGMKSIPRASVAHFLVKAVEHPETYSRTSVGLALGKE